MYDSIDRFHPFVTFLYYVSTITVFMLCMHPIFISVGAIITLLINFTHDRGQALRKWYVFIITTGFIILIMNPLFNERGLHVLFEIFQHRVTLEAVTYGAMSGLSIMGITMLFVNYNEVMTPNKLLFLCSKTLPKFAVLLMLTLRFIPLMRRRLEEITHIQKSKGISVSQGKWKEKVEKGLLIIQVLMTFSLEEAIQTADSMNARGYGKKSRTSYNHFVLKSKDIFLTFILICLLGSIIYGRSKGYGYLKVYPLMEPLFLTISETALLVLYMVLLSIPILLKIGGYIKWHILK